MISDFQLALGGAAAAIVVGVLVYNRWQETKYKRRAERAFGVDHPDVLIDGAGAGNKTASTNDRAAESRVEPAFAPSSIHTPTKRDAPAERVEPHIGGFVARAEAAIQPTVPISPRATNYQSASAPIADNDVDDLAPIGAIGEATLGMAIDVAHTVAPPALHAEIDSLALILADETLSPNQYQPMVAHTEKLGKGVRWEGLIGGLWQGILRDTHENFRELRAGMQLADRQGAIDHAALNAFNDLIVKFSASVNAVSQREDVNVAARRAQVIDAFCADTDIEIAVNVIG